MSTSNFESNVRVKGTLTVDGAISGDVGGDSVAVGTATLTDEGPGTLTIDAVGDSATLKQFSNGTWTIVALQGATVA